MKNCSVYRLYPLLCRALLVPALICSFAAPAVIPAAATETGAAGSTETSSGTSEANSAANASSDAASVNVPELILSKCYLLESDNYENIADGYYQAVLLTQESEKQYPALNSGLTEINAKITASCKDTFKDLAEKSKEFNAGNKAEGKPIPATLEYSIIPVRQDDKAVSFFTSCYSFLPGAAHGITTFKGITLDSASGREVALEEEVLVLRDIEPHCVSAVLLRLVLHCGSCGRIAACGLINYRSYLYDLSYSRACRIGNRSACCVCDYSNSSYRLTISVCDVLYLCSALNSRSSSRRSRISGRVRHLVAVLSSAYLERVLSLDVLGLAARASVIFISAACKARHSNA